MRKSAALAFASNDEISRSKEQLVAMIQQKNLLDPAEGCSHYSLSEWARRGGAMSIEAEMSHRRLSQIRSDQSLDITHAHKYRLKYILRAAPSDGTRPSGHVFA